VSGGCKMTEVDSFALYVVRSAKYAGEIEREKANFIIEHILRGY